MLDLCPCFLNLSSIFLSPLFWILLIKNILYLFIYLSSSVSSFLLKKKKIIIMVQCFHMCLVIIIIIIIMVHCPWKNICWYSLKPRMNICSCEGNLFLPPRGAWEYSWSGTTVDWTHQTEVPGTSCVTRPGGRLSEEYVSGRSLFYASSPTLGRLCLVSGVHFWITCSWGCSSLGSQHYKDGLLLDWPSAQVF